MGRERRRLDARPLKSIEKDVINDIIHAVHDKNIGLKII